MGTKAKMTISRAVSILNREKPAFLEGLSPAEVQMVVAKAGVQRYAANAGLPTRRRVPLICSCCWRGPVVVMR